MSRVAQCVSGCAHSTSNHQPAARCSIVCTLASCFYQLQYPDVNHGTVAGKPIREVLADSAEWLDGDFISVVQQRGAAIIKVREG